MDSYEAYEYAAQWGSYMRDGDPGACMYGFNEDFKVQSEEHRSQCIAHIECCKALVRMEPEEYDPDELDKLDELADAVLDAEVES